MDPIRNGILAGQREVSNGVDNPYIPNVGEIIDIRHETKTENTFVIALRQYQDIQCGQFYELSLPGVGEAPFSVSYIGDGFFETTIRKIGNVSNAIHNLKVKDKIYLRGPYGHGFPTEEFIDKELVIVAGGTAVAPVRALIRRVEEGLLKVSKLKILFGFRDEENLLFRDDIKRWQGVSHCLVSLDYPPEDWQGLSGFVNQHIDKLRLTADTEAVVVGPPAMIKFVVDELIEEGIEPKNIWVSLERLMQCGIGKCGHCRIESKYVCLDGPVFNYAAGKDMID